MNLSKIITLLALAFTMSGCVSHTSGGECIGALDDKVPGVQYKISGRNVLIALLFSETIVIPVVVVLTDLQCPVEL
jgi:hypothetical protein